MVEAYKSAAWAKKVWELLAKGSALGAASRLSGEMDLLRP